MGGRCGSDSYCILAGTVVLLLEVVFQTVEIVMIRINNDRDCIIIIIITSAPLHPLCQSVGCLVLARVSG